MNVRSRGALGAAVALLLFVGYGLGAVIDRNTPAQKTVAYVSVSPAPPAPPVAPLTRSRTSPPAVEPTHKPTAQPTAVPASIPRPAHTPSADNLQGPSATRTSAAGVWRFSEDNAIVGTIVWVGNAVSTANGTVFILHKESVAGQPAAPCERETNLRFVLPTGSAAATIPYSEVNCNGVQSSGRAQVRTVASGSHFSGTFWDGSRKLGDFDAARIAASL